MYKRQGCVWRDVGAASEIVFVAPSGLKVGTNRTRVINVLDYATDGSYTVTCGAATAIDTTELQSVTRITSGSTMGTATVSVVEPEVITTLQPVGVLIVIKVDEVVGVAQEIV